MNGDLSAYYVYYNYVDADSERFFQSSSDRFTLIETFDKVRVEVPFKDRLAGNINLINGNGSLTVSISNVQYNDSGEISLRFLSGAIKERVPINFDVQGMNSGTLRLSNGDDTVCQEKAKKKYLGKSPHQFCQVNVCFLK